MAPEQIHAKPVDGRVDLFAIGATMFRILTKRRIHEAETDAELLMKMGSTPAPSVLLVSPTINPRLAKLIDRALVFDRDRRYPDAVTMQADVRAVLRGEDPPHASAAALVSEERTAPERQLGARGASPSAGAGTDKAFAKTAAPGLARNPVNTGLVVLLGLMMLAVGAAGAFYFWGPPSQSSQRNAVADEGAEEDESEAPSSSKPTAASQTASALESAPPEASAAPSTAPSTSASAAKSTTATPLPRPVGSKPSSTGIVKPKKPPLKTPGRN
jgi:serine/threonine protein kinase